MSEKAMPLCPRCKKQYLPSLEDRYCDLCWDDYQDKKDEYRKEEYEREHGYKYDD